MCVCAHASMCTCVGMDIIYNSATEFVRLLVSP